MFFRNFFHYQSLKGHEGGSPPLAGLLRRPPTGSATTAGVRKESNEPGRWSNGPRLPQLRDRLWSEKDTEFPEMISQLRPRAADIVFGTQADRDFIRCRGTQ